MTIIGFSNLNLGVITEPVPTVPSMDERHSQLKHFLKCLNRSDWRQAKEAYLKLYEEDKTQIGQFILERNAKLPLPGLSLEADCIKQKIDKSFANMISNEGDTDLIFDFFKKLVIPAVNRYLIENFEQEKTLESTKYLNEVVVAVQSTIISSNFIGRDNRLKNYIEKQHFADPKSAHISHANRISNELELFDDERKAFLEAQPKINPYLEKLYNPQMANRFPYWNCEGMAERVAYTLKKDKKVKRIECANIIDGDHHFAIVNRKKNSDRNDKITWGRHCQVVDSWRNEKTVYRVDEIPFYLMDFIGNDFEMNTMLEPFDPANQSIELSHSDLYTSNDLRSLFALFSKDKAMTDWLIMKMQAFEKGSSEEKRNIAKEIIAKKLKLQSPSDKRVAKILVSQLQSFLNPDFAELYYIGPESKRSEFDKFNIDESYFENYVCSTTIDYLLLIAEQYQKGEIKKSDKKFQKLHPDLKKNIDDQFAKLTADYSDNTQDLWVDAIHMHIIEIVNKAIANQRFDEARKIFNKLPEHVRKKHSDLI